MAAMMQSRSGAAGGPDAIGGAGRWARLYIAAWSLLAAVALLYMALLVLRPDLAEKLMPRLAPAEPESNRGQRALAKALAEVEQLRGGMAELTREVAGLRETMAQRELNTQAMAARLAGLEARLAERPDGPQRIAAAAEARDGGQSGPAGLAGATVQGAVEEPALRPTRQATAAGGPAPPAVPPRPPAKAVPVALQVGTGPSVDALRLSWLLLQESHRATLKSLEPRFVEQGGDPPSYALLAGPVPDEQRAARICERLKARRVPCTITPLGGKPL